MNRLRILWATANPIHRYATAALAATALLTYALTR